MTERFPQQRNRSSQRRADANQVPAVIENTEFDDAHEVFDEDFIAAAAVREPSAEDRAVQRFVLPDQRTGDESFSLPPARWSVRPSHRFNAIRPLPVIAAGLCIMAVTTLLVMLLR